MPTTIQIAYELPRVVESVRNGWIATCQLAALMSTIFAVVATQIFVMSPERLERFQDKNQSTLTAFLAFGYLAIILNCGTVLTSFLLVDRLGDLTFSSSTAESGAPDNGQLIVNSTSHLMQLYGAGTSWSWMVLQWFISQQAGVFCLLVQITVFIWLHPVSLGVKVITLLAALFAFLPMLLLLPLKPRSK
ncbi:hypothetical protein HGRIS_006817 [Hohenbuehelia grisea]|uniref:Uncharacterized protein n=1 Tax=Hohenbuehelia grisea TaxID=104357 RepID=A0ABR3JA42_9AGAR